jgi:hypothetical protein
VVDQPLSSDTLTDASEGLISMSVQGTALLPAEAA